MCSIPNQLPDVLEPRDVGGKVLRETLEPGQIIVLVKVIHPPGLGLGVGLVSGVSDVPQHAAAAPRHNQ
jgi:hypothetical protein